MVVKGIEEVSPDAPIEDNGLVHEESDVCVYFSQRGTCIFGDRCRYRHEASASPTRAQGSGRLRGACPHFLSGNCRLGADCRKRHPGEEEAAEIKAELAAIPCQDGIHCKFWNCLYNHSSDAGIATDAVPEPLEHKSDQESLDQVVAEITIDSTMQQSSDWARYQTVEGLWWWWCEATEDWFMEHDGKGNEGLLWQAFLVPETDDAYWWSDDQHWFWVSSDGERGTWGAAPSGGS
eukprot:6133-Amphidinium_carterae.1